MSTANRLPDREITKTADGLTRRAFWLVTLDSAVSNGEEAALAVSGIPRIGTVHPDNSFYYCTSVTAAIDPEAKKLYKVSAEYATRSRKRPVDPSTTPTTEASSWTWHTTRQSRFYRQDTIGSTYLTSSGEPMDPKERAVSVLILRYSRNETSVPGGTANNQLLDKINPDPFLGYAIGCVKIADISADLIYSNTSLQYYRVNYEFHILQTEEINTRDGIYTYGGWIAEGARLDASFYDSTGDRIKDATGTSKVNPTMLDGYGSALTTGDTPIYTIYYEYKNDFTFGNLGISLV